MKPFNADGEAVVSVKGLTKHYGKIEALRGVTLNVRKGEIFGLLGQNGAGKTTMVKILLGITKSTEGDATLLGEPAGAAAVRKHVGYLPEDHRFPDYHTGYSLLDFYGALLELPAADRKNRIEEHLEMVGLAGRKHYKIRTYSKGMKQRLGIAQALFHNPEVIFLDEPTDGVDPVGRKHIREILLDLKQSGKTIFLNSHLLGEVELICDRVVILNDGEIIRQGSIEELTQQHGFFLIGLAAGQTFPGDEAAKQGYSVQPSGDLWEVGLRDGQSVDALVDLLRSRGLSIRHLVEKRQTLEDLFVETVEAVEAVQESPRLRTRRR